MSNMDKNDTIVDRVWVSAAVRHLSFAILLGLFCLMFPGNCFAQSSNRWLFVFNTSAAMRDRTNGMQAVTQDLLTTGMHGNIRPGDTIGIWTYNSELHAEEAPLQTWSPNTAPTIAYNTVLFLQQHRYEKSAAFDDVLANILRVIKISDTITIILISDGSDTVQGTPFDAQLTAFYKTNYQSQKKAHLPVVTVLRGEKGILTTNTVGLALAPADIPRVPPPPPVIAAAQTPEIVTPPPKPVPSLVIIGKKAETTFNVPTDLPDHSGDLPAQPSAAPAQAAPVPLVAKTETPVIAAPELAPTPKVEDKPKPAPVVDPTTPTALAPSQPVQSAAPQVATTTDGTKSSKTTAPPVEATAAAPQTNLFSARNIAIVSVVFTLLVCVLLLLSARNARRTARASLITRSLDRERN